MHGGVFIKLRCVRVFVPISPSTRPSIRPKIHSTHSRICHISIHLRKFLHTPLTKRKKAIIMELHIKKPMDTTVLRHARGNVCIRCMGKYDLLQRRYGRCIYQPVLVQRVLLRQRKRIVLFDDEILRYSNRTVYFDGYA